MNARFSAGIWAIFIALCATVNAQFIAFNDFSPGSGTHGNTTSTGTNGAVVLRDIVTGAAVGVTVTVTSAGVAVESNVFEVVVLAAQ